MARPLRQDIAGFHYHVLNRANAGMEIFACRGDYEAFLRLMTMALEREPVGILSFCLMPNHFHFVLSPREDGAMGRWMHLLMTTHVRRYHGVYGTAGHLWQGRYKSFPVQDDKHLYTVIRYTERNPLRANMVAAAEAWEWSSLHLGHTSPWDSLLQEWPVPRPPYWEAHVNAPQSAKELEALRTCIRRGRPYGTAQWTGRAATLLGLASTLRPRGRPKKGVRPLFVA